jgi:cytochrome c
MIIRGINAWIAGISLLFLFAILSLTARAAGQDAGAGKDVFAKRCTGCHAPDSEKEGPRLRGVLGRKAGTVPGFQYSDALRNSGIVWNESLLDKWLENPQALVKDNNMEFHVANAGEREALIAYLKSLAN